MNAVITKITENIYYADSQNVIDNAELCLFLRNKSNFSCCFFMYVPLKLVMLYILIFPYKSHCLVYILYVMCNHTVPNRLGMSNMNVMY